MFKGFFRSNGIQNAVLLSNLSLSVKTAKRLPVYFTEEEAAALLEAAAEFRYPARNVAMFRFILPCM